MQTGRTPGYQLKDELARFCLPAANHDPDRKLAWANSVCILFLLIGIIGARRGVDCHQAGSAASRKSFRSSSSRPFCRRKPTAEKRTADDEKPDAAPVAVVLPQTPNINFSVPTDWFARRPAASGCPPRRSNRCRRRPELIPSAAPVRAAIVRNRFIPRSPGGGGTRHRHSLITGDAAGNVISVEVKGSSGYPILDRARGGFCQNHWHLPDRAGQPVF